MKSKAGITIMVILGVVGLAKAWSWLSGPGFPWLLAVAALGTVGAVILVCWVLVTTARIRPAKTRGGVSGRAPLASQGLPEPRASQADLLAAGLRTVGSLPAYRPERIDRAAIAEASERAHLARKARTALGGPGRPRIVPSVREDTPALPAPERASWPRVSPTGEVAPETGPEDDSDLPVLEALDDE